MDEIEGRRRRCSARWWPSARASTTPSTRPLSPIPSNCACRPELMFLEIRHLTQYHYAEPVRESVMELWLQPQKSGRQRLISFDLELDPPAQLFSYADAFGNAVYHFDVPQPHERLTIVATLGGRDRARAPTCPTRWTWASGTGCAASSCRANASTSCSPTASPGHTDARSLHRRAQDLDGAAPARSADRRARTGETRLRRVRLRDRRHRGRQPDRPRPGGRPRRLPGLRPHHDRHLPRLGLPARYVSGYLFTDRAQRHDRSDPDATHAWVEVFLPSLRWVGFDPTNNIMAGERHVVVAVGRDYGDVPPSRGVFKGEADSQLAVGVSVRQARSAAGRARIHAPVAPAFSSASRRRPHRRGLRPAAAAAATAATTGRPPLPSAPAVGGQPRADMVLAVVDFRSRGPGPWPWRRAWTARLRHSRRPWAADRPCGGRPADSRGAARCGSPRPPPRR